MPQRKATRKNERRGSTRADASLSMQVEGQPGEGGLTKIVTESRNISGSGVYCHSPHYLAPLSKVALTLVLPSRLGAEAPRRLVRCEGMVVRCLPADRGSTPRRWELACSFLGLDQRLKVLLEDYVAWRNLQALRRSAGSEPRARTRTRRAPRAAAPARSASPRPGRPRPSRATRGSASR